MQATPHRCPPPSRAVHAIRNFSPFFLTVRFLVARAGGGSAELLGLAAARVGHKKVAVVGHEEVLDLALGSLVHVLLVEGHDGLCDGLADGVDLFRNIFFTREFNERKGGIVADVSRLCIETRKFGSRVVIRSSTREGSDNVCYERGVLNSGPPRRKNRKRLFQPRP